MNWISALSILCLLSCGLDDKSIAQTPENNGVVTITGNYEGAFNTVPVELYDPLTVSRKQIEFTEYHIDTISKTFHVKFKAEKLTPVLIFLKNVWVCPGDSVNIRYRVTANTVNKFRDTLIVSGNYPGNYACYYFFRNDYRIDHSYPDYLGNSKYKNNLNAFKQDMLHYFKTFNSSLQNFINNVAIRPEVKQRLLDEAKYLQFASFMAPFDYKAKSAANIPETYLSPFGASDFQDSSLLSSRIYCAALKLYHKYKTEQKTLPDFSVEHLEALYNDALNYTQPVKDFLSYSDVDLVDNNINSSVNDRHKEVLQRIYSGVQNTEIRKLLSRSVLYNKGDLSSFSSALQRVELISCSGKKISFNDLIKSNKGKALYLDFWASWCKPCIAEVPGSLALEKQYKNKNAKFITISQDEDIESWRAATVRLNLNSDNAYRLVNYRDIGVIQKELQFTAIPHYTLINNAGVLAYMNAPRPSENTMITKLLDQLTAVSSSHSVGQPAPPPHPVKR